MSNHPTAAPQPILAADKPARQQLPTLQVMRGVAALVVVAFHLNQFVIAQYHEPLWMGWFNRGFAGVDLFFVISGFVIVYTSRSYIGQISTLRTYLIKRAVRVYPIYWLTIALMTLLMALSLLVYPSGVGRVVNERWPGLDTLLLTPQHYALNIVSWSLSHELFFYLLFACLIVSRWLIVVPAFFLVGTLYMAITRQEYISGQASVWAYFWFNPLNAEFALGALVGYWFVHQPVKYWQGIGAAVAGIGWLSGLGDTFNESFSERLVHYGIASQLLLVAALVYERIQRPRWPTWLIRLGDASYLIYLLHPLLLLPFTRLLPRLFPVYSASIISLACFVWLCMVMALSVAAHLFVEKPLLRYLSARLLPPR